MTQWNEISDEGQQQQRRRTSYINYKKLIKKYLPKILEQDPAIQTKQDVSKMVRVQIRE